MAKPESRRGRPRDKRTEEQREFDQRILDLARVTRVTKGGKRMRFRACVVIGDKKGRVAQSVAKGMDVAGAVNKAVSRAKKKMIRVPIVKGTLPHAVQIKFAAAKVLLKPAPEGTGVRAGGAVRVVLELAGVPNATAKMLGSKNKINNAKATIKALSLMRGAGKAAPSRRSVGEGADKPGAGKAPNKKEAAPAK